MRTPWYGWRERNEGRIEAAYPWVVGAVAGLSSAFLLHPAFEQRAAPLLIDPIINVAAIAIAFLVAVAVMLAPLKATEPVIQELQRYDVFPRLLNYLKSAIYVWGAAIVLGLAVKVVLPEAVMLGSLLEPGRLAWAPRLTWLHVLASALTGTLIAGAMTGHRIIAVLFAFLRYRDPRKIKPRTVPPPGGEDEPLTLPEARRRATG